MQIPFYKLQQYFTDKSCNFHLKWCINILTWSAKTGETSGHVLANTRHLQKFLFNCSTLNRDSTTHEGSNETKTDNWLWCLHSGADASFSIWHFTHQLMGPGRQQSAALQPGVKTPKQQLTPKRSSSLLMRGSWCPSYLKRHQGLIELWLRRAPPCIKYESHPSFSNFFPRYNYKKDKNGTHWQTAVQ